MENHYVKTTKDLYLRTRGKTWDTIEPNDGDYIRVHIHGSDKECYVKVVDLNGRRDRIVLFEKIKNNSRTIPARILIHLQKKQPKVFTAADIAKDLNLTARSVGAHLQDIPGVTIKDRRKYAHTESGNRYTFEEVTA